MSHTLLGIRYLSDSKSKTEPLSRLCYRRIYELLIDHILPFRPEKRITSHHSKFPEAASEYKMGVSSSEKVSNFERCQKGSDIYFNSMSYVSS